MIVRVSMLLYLGGMGWGDEDCVCVYIVHE